MCGQFTFLTITRISWLPQPTTIIKNYKVSVELQCLMHVYLCVHVRLVWSGLVWSGLVWSGLVWPGLVWSCVTSALGWHTSHHVMPAVWTSLRYIRVLERLCSHVTYSTCIHTCHYIRSVYSNPIYHWILSLVCQSLYLWKVHEFGLTRVMFWCMNLTFGIHQLHQWMSRTCVNCIHDTYE